MSLETLLEAARYVEQQELQRARRPKTLDNTPLPNLTTTLSLTPQIETCSTISPATDELPSVAIPQTAILPAPASGTTLPQIAALPTLLLSSSSPPIGGDHLRAGMREVHNKLEKNRRAHLKECFELLRKQLPPQPDERKCSNLSILHAALRHIHALKKKERENEHEMERLARDKIAAQQRLAALRREGGGVDLPQVQIQPQQVVLGLHKVALVSSPAVAHLLAAPSQINGKVVPLVNAQYLVKPVVVVSTAGQGLPPS